MFFVIFFNRNDIVWKIYAQKDKKIQRLLKKKAMKVG